MRENVFVCVSVRKKGRYSERGREKGLREKGGGDCYINPPPPIKNGWRECM